MTENDAKAMIGKVDFIYFPFEVEYRGEKLKGTTACPNHWSAFLHFLHGAIVMDTP